MTAFADTCEVHPSAFLTVKLYIPAGSDEIVVLDPVPVETDPPGYRTRVHSPVSGMFSRRILPVARSQVGWVIVPITGAFGVTG